MLLFHGTTLQNAKKIQKEGFSYDKQVWNCSNEETYFFTEEFFWDEHDAEDFSEMWQHAISHTLDQSRIVLATENPDIYKGAVLVFDTELMSNKNDIEQDYSCENMENQAVTLVNPDMNGLVAVIYATEDEKESRPFMLTSLSQNDYFIMPEINSITEKIISALENTDFYEVLEELRCCENYQTTWIKENYLLTQDYSKEQFMERVAA